MILSDGEIAKRLKEKSLVIRPFSKENIRPSSCDLLLFNEVRVFDTYKTELIDVKEKNDVSRVVEIDPKKGFVIHPDEFVLGSTKEYFEIPDDLAGKLEGKSSLGRLGLVVHATAGFIDPGFKGYLTFEFSNVSRLPIRLYAGMRIAQICFFQMSSPAKRPYGCDGLRSKYFLQKGPTPSMIWKDFLKKNVKA